MKKFVCFALIICLVFVTACNCQKPNPLLDCVSELRSDVFFGQSEHYSLKASYGFRETPYQNDGMVKDKVYILHFILLDKELDQATYTITVNFNGQNYVKDFALHPITHVLSAQFEIDNFDQKTFTVNLACQSQIESITLSSTLPDNTISPQQALDFIYNSQKSFCDSFLSPDGTFNAEIYLRVLVKDAKAYYYVGFASGSNQLKAFLLDGLTGEVLAIRQIF